MSKLPMIAGITKLMIQMPKDAACMPIRLLLYSCNISRLAAALIGNSVKPMVGAIAITK